MMDKRLFDLLPHTKKYMIYHVLIRWFALMAQILAIFSLTGFMEKVMDDSYQRIDYYLVLAALTGTVVVWFTADRISGRMSFLAGSEAKQTLREQIYDKLLRMGQSYKKHGGTAEWAALTSEGVEQLGEYFGRVIPLVWYGILASITLFAVLTFVDWKVSLVLLGFEILVVCIGAVITKTIGCREKRREEQVHKPIDITGMTDTAAYIGVVLGVLITVYEFTKGSVTLAGSLTILLLSLELFTPFRRWGTYSTQADIVREKSERIRKLLELPEQEGGQESWKEQKTGIYMEDVSFCHADGRETLKEVSMNLSAGSFISLVGEPGCGKSTIAGILSGKNREYQGRILLGSREISDMAEEELLRHITLVGHDSHIFSGTLEENLRMAKPLATEDELLAVLARVNLLEYFQAREGLATRLMERGQDLSVGQRQLLALARALLHDTSIYLFDETASGIDEKSENRIIWIIGELAKEKTVLLISDNLLHAIRSDCVYMMEAGRVIEKGTHKQLMQQNGAYRRLFMSQYREREEQPT